MSRSPSRARSQPVPASSPEATGSLGSYTDTDWDITSGVGFTALAVAAGRAMETARPDPLISDPHAADFVTAAQAEGEGVAGVLPTAWPPDTPTLTATAAVDARQLHELWTGMATYLGVRTRFFDQYCQTACHDAGIGQVVVLAAGLDTRAHRLAWPAGTRLFEIDHPNVLAFKDRVLSGLGALPGCERHTVGADLREDWPAALRQAGFDPTQPTAWLAEGLIFFLPDDVKQLLCQRVQDLSTRGSRWAIESIAQPGAAIATMRDNSVLQRIGALFGADPSGLWPPEQQWEPHHWLLQQGWTVTAASARTVAAGYGRVLDGPPFIATHDHPSMLLAAAYDHPHPPAVQRPPGRNENHG